jgi:hypothetical protein
MNPIQAIIYMYMEVPQGNFLCSYLEQAKMSLFFLLQNWKTVRWNGYCLREKGWHQWRGRKWGKCIGGLMWCKYCVHMYINGKQ